LARSYPMPVDAPVTTANGLRDAVAIGGLPYFLMF
jgi:hypothetical protein